MHLKPNWSMFFVLSQNISILRKIIEHPEANFSRPRGSWVIDQNVQNTVLINHLAYTKKLKWVIWLFWAIVGQYMDKMTQKYVKNESFCPCSDPLWLKWVKWLIWVFLYTSFSDHLLQDDYHFWCTVLLILRKRTKYAQIWFVVQLVL